MRTDPLENVFYFEGVDSAPAQGARSDDGGKVIGRAVSRFPFTPTEDETEPVERQPSDFWFDLVHAQRVRGASVDQWSGLIHTDQLNFRLAGICMDAGGGGQWIRPKLAERRQLIAGVERETVPILARDEKFAVVGIHNLTMFKRGDPGMDLLWPGLAGDELIVDLAHANFTEAIDRAWVRICRGLPTADWPAEKKIVSKTLREMVTQLGWVTVLTNDQGQTLTTRRGARQFGSRGKKDLAYAAMYAYVAFLIWLKSPEGIVENMMAGADKDDGFMGW